MNGAVLLIILSVSLALPVATRAQDQKQPNNPPENKATQAPPSAKDQASKNDQPYKDEDGLIHRPNPGSSSSKGDSVDLSPPSDDDQTHPNSGEAVREAEDAAGLLQDDELGGIQEFHPWDPHRAQKDIEVGDFYFKRENYRAALDRYQEALYYKNNDAVATYRLAVCQEKLGQEEDARKSYQSYLKILPEGPFAADAKKALGRLGGPVEDKARESLHKKDDAPKASFSPNPQ